MREPYLALKVGESHRGRYRRGLPGHCQKALETIPLVRSIASSDAIRRLGAQVRQTSVFKAESLRRIAAVPRNRFNVTCVRWWETTRYNQQSSLRPSERHGARDNAKPHSHGICLQD